MNTNRKFTNWKFWAILCSIYFVFTVLSGWIITQICLSSQKAYLDAFFQAEREQWEEAKEEYGERQYELGYYVAAVGLESNHTIGLQDVQENGYAKHEQSEENSYIAKYSYAPLLLNYVKKYSDDPEAYLAQYDSVWGDLTASEGDIQFETLTSEQRELVHFPPPAPLPGFMCYVEGRGNSYHAVSWCYTLLRTKKANYKDIRYGMIKEAGERGLSPCSKCVGPMAYEDVP